MTEPRTPTGRDYAAWEATDDASALDRLNERLGPHWELIDVICAIEAEALPSAEQLARALDLAGMWYDLTTNESICRGDLDEVAAAILAALAEPEAER